MNKTSFNKTEKSYLATLEGFSKIILGLGDNLENWYEWMEDVYAIIEQHGCRLSLRTPNGAGKTTHIIAPAILWHMGVFPRSKVISTTASIMQLRDQLFAELLKYQDRFDGWDFLPGTFQIRAPNGSRYSGFVTRESGRAEGHHGNKNPLFEIGRDDGPLFIIVDEAKSVPDIIFDAFDRCTYQRFLQASTPGWMIGKFYYSQTSPRSPWTTYRVNVNDCPHIDKEQNDALIAEKGIHDPLVRSKILAEFMDVNKNALFSALAIERCINSPPDFKNNGDIKAMCDFACGGDENVLAVRRGNEVKIVAAWREVDTMAACARFIMEFKKEDLKAQDIYGDADGAGKPMMDALRAAGWPINPVRNGARADNPNDCVNWAAESWYLASKKVEMGEIRLPDDEVLKIQLMTRGKLPGSKGRIQLETKRQLRKRGIESPDRADAIIEAMRDIPSRDVISFSGTGGRGMAHLQDLLNQEMESVGDGSFAGY